MIVWGGRDESGNLSRRGARYKPSDNSWTEITTPDALLPREGHTAVWTGSEMIVWGGNVGVSAPKGVTNTGARYNLSSNTWAPVDTASAASPRQGHIAVWTGSKMIVWGGRDEFEELPNHGALYDPAADLDGTWVATDTANAPLGREGHTAVWANSKMIVWGGSDQFGLLPDQVARFDPATDPNGTWIVSDSTNAPSGRKDHTAVWTGKEMIVWGGDLGGVSGLTNTGARYDPSTNSWTPMDTTNAPTRRKGHTAVWTGSEMIVWGGTDGSNLRNDGGVYVP